MSDQEFMSWNKLTSNYRLYKSLQILGYNPKLNDFLPLSQSTLQEYENVWKELHNKFDLKINEIV